MQPPGKTAYPGDLAGLREGWPAPACPSRAPVETMCLI